MRWLAHILGLTNASGPWYLAWSGIVSDLPEFAIAALVWRRINCHARGCWRIGLHRVESTHFHVCRAHHPGHDGKRAYTAEQIAEHAERAGDRRP